MAKVRPRKLVVDASVTGQANDYTDERSLRCADFLVAIREARHAVVLTDALLDEWHRHKSRFTDGWLRSMYAAKRDIELDVLADEDFRKHVERAAADRRGAAIMLKDCHLIEAALAADNRIASLDEEARHHLGQAAARVKPLQRVCWVNPAVAEELPVEWLHQGAPLERHRLLGTLARQGG